MPENKHTPGPWSVVEEPMGFTIYDPSGDEMATVYKDTRARDDEIEATAYIMGVASELLIALENLLADRGRGDMAAIKAAHDAIAKARRRNKCGAE